MKTIVEQIFSNGADHPEKIALVNGKRELSYKDLLNGILFARKQLHEKYGLTKGDAAIVAADKQIEFVFVYFACHLLGVTALPIAPDTNQKRYELIKSKTKPSLIIGFEKVSGDDHTVALCEFQGAMEGCNDSAIIFPEMDDVADIIFTTGTTGEPKGVLLSHRNIAAAAHNINTFIRNDAVDVEMLALPISHSFGIGRMRCALSNCQTLVMLGSFVNVKRFFRYMKEYGVTGFGMVPASWALLKKLSGEEIERFKNQLHYIEIGSAPMPLPEKKLLAKLLPYTRICMHYGLTEASRSAFIEFHQEKDYLMTVGKQSPNMYISIKNEHGEDVPVGDEGEICVKGEAVTGGYLGLARDEFFWGDYFRTGDWGSLAPDGYITLRSRKKELINVGGKKVSPMEVEEVLMELDFVKDCACKPIADPEKILGEVVKAYIVTDHPEKVVFEDIDRSIGKSLEGYKHPVEYAVIDEIPKTASGKVQRLLLP